MTINKNLNHKCTILYNAIQGLINYQHYMKSGEGESFLPNHQHLIIIDKYTLFFHELIYWSVAICILIRKQTMSSLYKIIQQLNTIHHKYTRRLRAIDHQQNSIVLFINHIL